MADMKWQVQMDRDAWDKMWAYTDLLVGEVACFGYVELDEENKIAFVSEVFLVPQTASASEVDFMTKGLPFAIDKAIMDGKIDQLRFCVHSHGEFTANWSSTDEDMLRKVGSTGTPWFVSAIFNRKGDSTARIDIFGDAGPFGKTQHVLKDLDIVAERNWDTDEARLAEIEEFVTIPPKPVKKVGFTGSTYTNRPAGTTTQPKLPAATKDKYPRTTMLGDSVVKIDWGYVDDSTGTRWYYDDDEFWYGVKSDRFSTSWLPPIGDGSETENAVVAI
jgi:hypothetical protein